MSSLPPYVFAEGGGVRAAFGSGTLHELQGFFQWNAQTMNPDSTITLHWSPSCECHLRRVFVFEAKPPKRAGRFRRWTCQERRDRRRAAARGADLIVQSLRVKNYEMFYEPLLARVFGAIALPFHLTGLLQPIDRVSLTLANHHATWRRLVGARVEFAVASPVPPPVVAVVTGGPL